QCRCRSVPSPWRPRPAPPGASPSGGRKSRWSPSARHRRACSCEEPVQVPAGRPFGAIETDAEDPEAAARIILDHVVVAYGGLGTEGFELRDVFLDPRGDNLLLGLVLRRLLGLAG